MKEQEKYERLYEWLITSGTATERDIYIAEWLIGEHYKTLEHLLYILTGYRTLDQITEEE